MRKAENANVSGSLGLEQLNPAGTLDQSAMRIATGPASSNWSTRPGAFPKTFAKSLRRSSVARRTAVGSSALSTIVTELSIVISGLGAPAVGNAATKARTNIVAEAKN